MTRLGTSFATLLLALLLASPAAAQVKICIDAGHGGNDPGAVGNSLQEKDVNLTTALAFRDWANADTSDGGGGGSWNVLMTRDTDVYVSLSGRASYANSNGADYFLSIHANAGGGNGTETYAYASGGNADAMAHKVNEEVVAHLGTNDRGVKYASFTVLTNTSMPADLNELAFLDVWSGNAEILSDPANLDDVGLAHLHGIQRHIGLSAYTPGNNNNGPPQGDPTGTVSVTSYPQQVVGGVPFEVSVGYETDLYTQGQLGQIEMEAKDFHSWDILDHQIWDNNGQGLSGPSGGHTFTLNVPPGAYEIYFMVTLSPLGGGWSDQLDHDGTFMDPTDVLQSNGDNDGDGYDVAGGDCNDANPNVYPGATELADHEDNDCDGTVDEGTDFYDDDGDGYTEDQGDCDDDWPYTYPGADECNCDGKDNDCDGLIDESGSCGDGGDFTDDDGHRSTAGGDDPPGPQIGACMCHSGAAPGAAAPVGAGLALGLMLLVVRRWR